MTVPHNRTPQAAADELIKLARRGNPDLVSAVEPAVDRMNRNALLSVLRLLFVELAELHRIFGSIPDLSLDGEFARSLPDLSELVPDDDD